MLSGVGEKHEGPARAVVGRPASPDGAVLLQLALEPHLAGLSRARRGGLRAGQHEPRSVKVTVAGKDDDAMHFIVQAHCPLDARVGEDEVGMQPPPMSPARTPSP